MPGIFGLIRKRDLSKDIKINFKLMSDLLNHLPFYHNDNYFSDELAIGNVFIQNNYKIKKVSQDGRDYLIFIDGHIYSIDGEPFIESSLSVMLLKKIVNIFLSNKNKIIKIEGNYTIGIYDFFNRELNLFSDIIGPKKLYFANLSDQFVFSPEIKAISFLPEFKKELNWKGISDFFNYGYILGDDTFFQSIRCLPSASILNYNIKTNTVKVYKYWKPSYSSSDENINLLADTCLDKLEKSIDEKITTNDSVVCPISGGLDSRLIISMLSENKKNVSIKPVTHGQKFSYEYKYAVQVCKSLNIKNPSLVEINAASLLDKYKQAVWLSEGMVPLLNAHLLLYYPIRDSSDSCFLNGVYGGPTNYDSPYYGMHHISKKMDINGKSDDIRKILSLNPDSYKNCFVDDVFRSIKKNCTNSIQKELEKSFCVSDLFCNQRDNFFIENRMRRFICQMSLLDFFWEAQLPLSNYSLYSFYLSIPPELKINRLLLKTMIKKRFPKQAGIKDANTGLNLFQRENSLYRIKRKIIFNYKYYAQRLSFGKITFYNKSTYNHYPIWLIKDKKTRMLFEKILFSEQKAESMVFNIDSLRNMTNHFYKTGLNFHNIVRVVTFMIWYDLFFLNNRYNRTIG